jgi:hypothetical protein
MKSCREQEKPFENKYMFQYCDTDLPLDPIVTLPQELYGGNSKKELYCGCALESMDHSDFVALTEAALSEG